MVGLLSLAGGFVIIAVLGAVGTIGAQMVGAIFMRMNTAIATNLQAFHGRLVDTHQILFGNLIGNRVQGIRRRSETWAQMALAWLCLRFQPSSRRPWQPSSTRSDRHNRHSEEDGSS